MEKLEKNKVFGQKIIAIKGIKWWDKEPVPLSRNGINWWDKEPVPLSRNGK